jgi:hypothetical protein
MHSRFTEHGNDTHLYICCDCSLTKLQRDALSKPSPVSDGTINSDRQQLNYLQLSLIAMLTAHTELMLTTAACTNTCLTVPQCDRLSCAIRKNLLHILQVKLTRAVIV